MGRQIAIAMTREDETQFLSFLRTSSVVRVFHFSAPSVAELEIAGPDLGEGSQYFISPAVFNWKPEFKQVSQLAPVVERRGWSYISNTATAPVLAYDRHSFSKPAAQGRLYWAKSFAAPNGVSYDALAFEAWYEHVVRWVKKTGRRIKTESHGPYYLPSAHARQAAASLKKHLPSS